MVRRTAKAPAGRTTKRATGYDKLTSRRIPRQVNPDAVVRTVQGSIMAKVNFVGVSNAFEPVPVSQAEVTIAKLEVKQPATPTNAKGEERFPYVNVELTLGEGEYQGRKVFMIWSLSPKALWRLKQDAVKFGVDPEIFDNEEGVDIEGELLPLLNGRSAIANLTIQEYTANDGSTKSKNVVTSIEEIEVRGRR